jgi:NodT family efflux transporter outer membrane factor (OMF) lipoprotein
VNLLRLPRRLLPGLALLAGCAAAPPYDPPKPELPAAWKIEAPFRAGEPGDAKPKGAWWERFGDEKLNGLVAQALKANPTLAAAGARFAQARAALAAVSGQAYPQVALGVREQRFRITENRPLTNYRAPNFSTTQTDTLVAPTASYEVDLAGRVAASIAGARASAEQSAADFENVRLLMIADLCTAYFNLRQTDVELDVLGRAVALQRQSLELARARHDLGAASGLDVAQQQSLIDTTLTQVDLLRRQRAQYEHALATLAGTPAPVFSLAADLRRIAPPAVPLGLPSDILERRPDVASAERAMAAANAQVGVANAAFYPSVILGAAAGAESRTLGSLFNAPSLVWSLGATLLQPIFDGGRLRGNLDFAKAGYEATAANYRRVLLTAMQEAEDGIIGLAALERASAQSQASVESARRVLDLVNARYEGGVANSLEVITAQQSLLSSERLASQLDGQRLLTTVFLVKALGGDWEGPIKSASRN